MKITRVGARADNGPRSISFTPNTTSYNQENDCVEIRAVDVTDFSNENTHHNYTIELSCEEIADSFQKLIENMDGDNSKNIINAFDRSIKHLLKLSDLIIKS